ncbi:hypothetical protein GEMRC1_010348 [Eukaryota sp. GEM-RC1]
MIDQLNLAQQSPFDSNQSRAQSNIISDSAGKDPSNTSSISSSLFKGPSTTLGSSDSFGNSYDRIQMVESKVKSLSKDLLNFVSSTNSKLNNLKFPSEDRGFEGKKVDDDRDQSDFGRLEQYVDSLSVKIESLTLEIDDLRNAKSDSPYLERSEQSSTTVNHSDCKPIISHLSKKLDSFDTGLQHLTEKVDSFTASSSPDNELRMNDFVSKDSLQEIVSDIHDKFNILASQFGSLVTEINQRIDVTSLRALITECLPPMIPTQSAQNQRNQSAKKDSQNDDAKVDEQTDSSNTVNHLSHQLHSLTQDISRLQALIDDLNERKLDRSDFMLLAKNVPSLTSLNSKADKSYVDSMLEELTKLASDLGMKIDETKLESKRLVSNQISSVKDEVTRSMAQKADYSDIQKFKQI